MVCLGLLLSVVFLVAALCQLAHDGAISEEIHTSLSGPGIYTPPSPTHTPSNWPTLFDKQQARSRHANRSVYGSPTLYDTHYLPNQTHSCGRLLIQLYTGFTTVYGFALFCGGLGRLTVDLIH